MSFIKLQNFNFIKNEFFLLQLLLTIHGVSRRFQRKINLSSSCFKANLTPTKIEFLTVGIESGSTRSTQCVPRQSSHWTNYVGYINEEFNIEYELPLHWCTPMVHSFGSLNSPTDLSTWDLKLLIDFGYSEFNLNINTQQLVQVHN